MEIKKVRTRIAPSPTGYPHIATIYQALFDFAFAQKNKGKFLVRIEDTDKERFVPDAEGKLFSALDWFGLKEDESPRKGGKYGPYRQSERLDLYQKYAAELTENGYAYYCFCTRERLEEMRKKQQAEKKPVMYDQTCRKLLPGETARKLKENSMHVIRMKVPGNTKIVVKDELRGEIEFDSNMIDDQVILKSDGFPTYHLAVVVDDHLMEISHIVRGEEWLTSTPKHYLLYDFLGFEKPLFYHTPVLRNPDNSKLSKRQGHTGIDWYRQEGYLPEAILNYISLLGWSHPEGKEIFLLSEFIRLFDLKDINPVGPVFDLNKLTWMNQKYIQSIDSGSLKKYLKEQFPELKDGDKGLLDKLLPLVRTRMSTLKEFRTLTWHFFEEPEPVKAGQKEKEIVAELINKLQEISAWNKENIFNVFKPVMQEHAIRMPMLYNIFTGSEKGLPLPESLEILGKEKTIARLKKYI